MASHRHAENAFLLAAIGNAPQIHDARGNVATLDWEYLIRAARLHGVSSLLYAATEADDGIPGAARDALRTTYWTTHFRNRTLLDELERILRAASARGMCVMPLKGALLAPQYYAAPALRPMSDLDLLVQPHDLRAFADLLTVHGYTAVEKSVGPVAESNRDPIHAEHAFIGYHADEPVLIEFRAEPLDPVGMGFLALDGALAQRLRQHAAGMWVRSEPDSIRDIPYTRAVPEDLLLHIASHLTTRHTNFRLLWLHDLCVVIARHETTLDWQRLMDDARTVQLHVPVLAALEAAHNLLGAPVPVQRLQRLYLPRSAVMQRTEHRLFMRQAAALPDADLASMPMIPTWLVPVSLMRLRSVRARLRAIGSLIAPSRAYMSQWTSETVRGEARYGRALLLRALLGVLRLAALASARIRSPRLSRGIQRLAARAAATLHLPLVPPDRGDTTPQRWL